MNKVITRGSDFLPSEPIGWVRGSWRGWKEIAAKFHFFVKTFNHHIYGNAYIKPLPLSMFFPQPQHRER